MDKLVIRRVMVMALLTAEYALATLPDQEVSIQLKPPTLLQKLEKGSLKAYCKVGGFLPQWLSTVPLGWRPLKERIIEVGAGPSCLDLLLKVEYKFPSSSEIKRLKKSNVPIMWVLGGPGSGKGTFCSKFKDAESYTHISLGDLLRDEVAAKPDSSIARLIQDTMKQGQLLPDYFSLRLLTIKMLSEVDNTKGFLLDGYPRTIGQAKLFQKKIKAPDAIIILEASDDILKKRVLNRKDGRMDDNEETLQERLHIYHKQTQAIVTNKMFAKKVKIVNAEGRLHENFVQFSEAVHESLQKL